MSEYSRRGNDFYFFSRGAQIRPVFRDEQIKNDETVGQPRRSAGQEFP
jgi:hypothetical protein